MLQESNLAQQMVCAYDYIDFDARIVIQIMFV